MYLTISVGYFIKIAGIMIDYYRFMLYFLGALATIRIIRSGIKEKFLLYVLGLAAVIFFGYIFGEIIQFKIVPLDNGGWGGYLFGVDNEETISFGSTQIKFLLDFFFTVMTLIYVKKHFTYEDWNVVLSKVGKWIKIVLIYGCIEVIVVYILHTYSVLFSINSAIFGHNESTYANAYARGAGYQLQGLFREPAQYARGLFISAILFFYNWKRDKRGNSIIWVLIPIGLMLLSMSFTSLLLIFTLLVLYILFKCKENPVIQPIVLNVGGILIILMIIIGIMLIRSGGYYGQRLQNALAIVTTMMKEEDLNQLYFSLAGIVKDGSSILRIGSSYANLVINLPKNFLFGIGLGNSCSFSYTSNLITDLGIIGLLLYLKLFVFWNKKSLHYWIACIAFFISSLFTSVTQTFGIDVILLFYLFDALFSKKAIETRKKAFLYNQNTIIVNNMFSRAERL